MACPNPHQAETTGLAHRLQQIYAKLDVHQPVDPTRDEGAFNLRARAVSVATLRKLLNYGALERAEAELQVWLKQS